MDNMVVVFETPLGAAILRPRSWCDECRKNGRPVLPGLAMASVQSKSFKKRTAPRPRSNEWTVEEDEKLFQYRDVKYISEHILPKRTVRAIRDRRTLLRRRQAGRQPPSS